MSATVLIHGPFEFSARLIGEGKPDAFTNLDVKAPGTSLALIGLTRADCDDLIKAALAARDLLPEPEPDPDVHGGARAGDDLPDSKLPGAADYIRDTAREIERHGENHISNDGQVVSAIHPGECIGCHGHATADGTWHPAMAS